MGEAGKAEKDFTVGSVPKLLLMFSLPILVSNILETCYNLVDMAIVGKYVGSTGLSAVSVGSDILHVILLASNGFSNAAQIIISQLMGHKNKDAVNRSVGTMLGFVFVFSLLLTAIMLCVNTGILKLMNTPGEAWDEAVRYSAACYFGIIFTFGYGVLGAVLRGMGDSKHPMVFITVASVVNVILDILFVVVLKMGAYGAALATVMGQGLSFVWSLAYVYRHRERFGLDIGLTMFKPDRMVLFNYLKLALPLCLQKALVQLANLYINSFIYAYGVTITAVTGIGTKLSTLCQMFSNAMLRGGSSVVGQNIGANKLERVKKVVYINALYAFVVWVMLSVVTVIFRIRIFGLFTNDELVLEMSLVFLPTLIIRYLMFCIRCPFMALINGVGAPKVNFAIGIVDGLVLRIGLSLLLGIVLDMGVLGFWYGNAFGGFAPLFIGGYYFFSGKWENDALIKAN